LAESVEGARQSSIDVEKGTMDFHVAIMRHVENCSAWQSIAQPARKAMIIKMAFGDIGSQRVESPAKHEKARQRRAISLISLSKLGCGDRI
jgi:hypothetical protein